MKLICSHCGYKPAAERRDGDRCDHTFATDLGAEERCGGYYLDVERDRDREARGQLTAFELA
jgi:hypothetical protein